MNDSPGLWIFSGQNSWLSPPTAHTLSDVTLGYWFAQAETAPAGELGTINWPWVARSLITELRTTRVREQALQQRIAELEGSA